MLTPIFEVKQDDGFVIVIMKVPHIKASEIDYYFEEHVFKFHAKPYFLRLTFSQSLGDEGTESLHYDISQGIFTIQLPKRNPGEYFADLDLLTKLLEKKKDPTTLINPSTLVQSMEQKSFVELDEDKEIDWEMDQQLQTATNDEVLLTKPHYGFNNQYCMYFGPLMDEIREILDLPDPDNTAPSQRAVLRVEQEDAKFDPDHYMMDFVSDAQIQELIAYECWWEDLLKKKAELKKQAEQQTPIPADASTTPPQQSSQQEPDSQQAPLQQQPLVMELITFTDKEKEELMRLPNKDYLIEDEKTVYLSLVDILFAYAYNHRTTLGENTVESNWTVAKLSPLFSFLQAPSSLREVLIACIRRSLTFPLYRHWELAQKVVRDVKIILKLGKRCVLKCLLDAKYILDHSDAKFHLSRIFLNDYCVWIQSSSSKILASLVQEFQKVQIKKEEVGWPLCDLEAQAKEFEQESEFMEE